jgi:hypothetical protein
MAVYLLQVEPDDGELGSIRFRCQLAVVHENEYHSLPEQS